MANTVSNQRFIRNQERGRQTLEQTLTRNDAYRRPIFIDPPTMERY